MQDLLDLATTSIAVDKTLRNILHHKIHAVDTRVKRAGLTFSVVGNVAPMKVHSQAVKNLMNLVNSLPRGT